MNDDLQNDTLENILILEDITLDVVNLFSLKTAWIEMSGQEARYHSSILFSKANKEFSWAFEVKDVVTLIWDAKKEISNISKVKTIRPNVYVFGYFIPFYL